jgi:hypothetical protein
MATIIDVDFGTTSNRATKNPWKEWADGQTRQLTNPEDFTSKTTTLMQQARKYAAANGLRAMLREVDEKTVVVKFVPKADQPQPPTDDQPAPVAPVAPPTPAPAGKGKRAKG